jgi:hypothetical protein
LSEGTVFQRSDGRWCAKYKDIRGKWKYLYRKSKGEAKRALRQALKDRDEGIVPPSKMTVGALLDEWIEDMREDVSHRTWLNREGFVRLHIKPAIANTTLANLTADDARKLCRQKTRQGLASSSVRRIHELLYQALRYGVSSKYISPQPAGRRYAAEGYLQGDSRTQGRTGTKVARHRARKPLGMCDCPWSSVRPQNRGSPEPTPRRCELDGRDYLDTPYPVEVRSISTEDTEQQAHPQAASDCLGSPHTAL